MSPEQLQQQATQSAAQGQQRLQDYQNQAGQYKQSYQQYQQQSDAARQQQQEYAQYMQGAGSAQNIYQGRIGQSMQEQGLGQGDLGQATQNLTRSQNAMAQVQAAAAQGAGGYGLSGAQIGGFYGAQAAPLQAQVQSSGTAVSNLQGLYQNALKSASDFLGGNIEQQKVHVANLSSLFEEANKQAEESSTLMQFFNKMAQDQGGLNAQQSQMYAQALKARREADTAIAQSQMLMAQSAAFYATAAQTNKQTSLMKAPGTNTNTNSNAGRPTAAQSTPGPSVASQIFSPISSLGRALSGGAKDINRGYQATNQSLLNFFSGGK
jgi:hypothetical protein